MTPEERVLSGRLQRARETLSAKYGNLYGIKLRRWVQFNGQTAVIVGDTPQKRKENLARFEERLENLRNSHGQGSHRARRAMSVSR